MERSNCRCGTDPERISSGAQGAAEAKEPARIRRAGTAVRYLYLAGALAAAALLIVLAAV